MNTVFAAGTFFLPSTIERWGRRPILMWTAFGCFICMLIFVIMIGLPHKNNGTQWTAVAFIIIYNLLFGYGWIGIRKWPYPDLISRTFLYCQSLTNIFYAAWLYGPEIAPLKYRHLGGAAGAFGEWLFSFITVFAGGIAIQNIGWKIWIWQVLSCALAVVFVYFMCPEVCRPPFLFA
jgi:MFS family permease